MRMPPNGHAGKIVQRLIRSLRRDGPRHDQASQRVSDLDIQKMRRVYFLLSKAQRHLGYPLTRDPSQETDRR